MIETAEDTRLYAKAIAKVISDTPPPMLDETMESFMRRVAADAIAFFEDAIDVKRRERGK